MPPGRWSAPAGSRRGGVGAALTIRQELPPPSLGIDEPGLGTKEGSGTEEVSG